MRACKQFALQKTVLFLTFTKRNKSKKKIRDENVKTNRKKGKERTNINYKPLNFIIILYCEEEE